MAEPARTGASGESTFTVSRERRNLAHLNQGGSSGRVLNLTRLYINHKDDADYALRPLFDNSALNRAIILKHTLRGDERALFRNHRQTVTKIILPFDPHDLALGGRSFFFRQAHYEELMHGYLNIHDMGRNRDVDILRCMDGLPSLDPFLLREHLGRMDIRPADVYFRIAPQDLKAMSDFTATEVENLVTAAFGDSMKGGAMRLGAKILADDLDKELAPLKDTLGMSELQFSHGITCWRGFLYYKWCYVELQESLRQVLSGLSGYKPIVTHDEALKTYLARARPRIARALVKTLQDTGQTLEAYDDVYRDMAVSRNPEPFRQFLMNGSTLFLKLGETIGVLNHIVSFWNFRLARVLGNRPLESVEYADILIDFEASLANCFREK